MDLKKTLADNNEEKDLATSSSCEVWIKEEPNNEFKDLTDIKNDRATKHFLAKQENEDPSSGDETVEPKCDRNDMSVDVESLCDEEIEDSLLLKGDPEHIIVDVEPPDNEGNEYQSTEWNESMGLLNLEHPNNVKIREHQYKCYHCAETRRDIMQLKMHIKSVHVPQLEKGIPAKLNYRVSIAKPTKRGQYRSREYILDDENRKLYICPLCDFRSYHCSSIRSHIRARHTHEKLYQCPYCEYRAVLSGTLRTHIKCKHTQEKPHQCPYCEYRANLRAALKSHILYKHVQEKPHKCPYCEYTATLPGTVKVHIMNKHSEDKPHQCPQCDYTAAQYANLKIHIMYKHTQEKPHKCPYCDHRTTESGNLKTHIKYKHTKEKPHRCPYCSYQATEMGTMNCHVMSKHTKIRPHQCPQCKYSATLPHTLKAHIAAKHTKERPHQCPHCQYRASRFDHLKCHIFKRHTRNQQLQIVGGSSSVK